MHDQSNGCSRTDRDGRLNAKIARNELIAGARCVLLRRLTYCLDEVTFARKCQIGTDTQECRYGSALEQRPGVEIDFVGKAGIACGIGCRHIIHAKRPSIGKDDALPDDQCAPLTKGDNTVIAADEARALWD